MFLEFLPIIYFLLNVSNLTYDLIYKWKLKYEKKYVCTTVI